MACSYSSEEETAAMLAQARADGAAEMAVRLLRELEAVPGATGSSNAASADTEANRQSTPRALMTTESLACTLRAAPGSVVFYIYGCMKSDRVRPLF